MICDDGLTGVFRRRPLEQRHRVELAGGWFLAGGSKSAFANFSLV